MFVPQNSLEKVSDAIFNAGGGIIGEYGNCSFQSSGEGTFKGSEKSNPSIGEKNKFERVNEVRAEFLVSSWKLRAVISAVLKSHPYEEPAYDIYPLKNKNVNYGAGAIGQLAKVMSAREFLLYICKTLKTPAVKYCDGKEKKIKNVAVCGGAGVDLLNSAISFGADAFVTADIKYHQYHDALGKILLIDAGHYETEILSLNVVQKKIIKCLSTDNKIKVFKYSGNTNPVRFYKQ